MNRLPRLAAMLAVTALFAACGDDEGSSGETTTSETPAATATAEQTIQQQDGFLLGADEQKVVLRTQEGEQVFQILPEDLEAVGVPHLASHAGLTDIGFRVYYEERDGTKYIKGSEEIAPPF